MKGKRPLRLLILVSPFIAGWIALFVGAFPVSPMAVINALFQEILRLPGIPSSPEHAIIIDIRLPRVILSGLVGMALSGSGVTLQGIFRNPLVDPFILGISAGAALGCALSIGFLSQFPLQLMAFAFGMAAVALTYTIAKSQGEISRLPLILSGVIISAFFTAMVSIVKFLVDPHKLQSIVFWLMGSFSLSDWRLVKIAGLGIGVGLLPCS